MSYQFVDYESESNGSAHMFCIPLKDIQPHKIQVQYVALRKQPKRPGSRFFKELGINEMCLVVN